MRNKGSPWRFASTKHPLFCWFLSSNLFFSVRKKKLPLSSNADNSKHETEYCYLLKHKGNCARKKWRSLCKPLHMLIETVSYYFPSFSEEGGAGS